VEAILSELFTAADTWNGGFYELAIELGPRLGPRSDERLRTALETIWQYDGLDGCYEDEHVEPLHQTRLPPTIEKTKLLGVATLPDRRQAACGTVIVREDDFTGRDDGSDWVVLFLPMGALDSVYNVGAYPFEDGKDFRTWRKPLDDWLARVAAAVFAAVLFPLALIGHEVSGTTYAAEISNTGLPAERWVGYLWQEGEHLAWYPPTQYEADFTFDS